MSNCIYFSSHFRTYHVYRVGATWIRNYYLRKQARFFFLVKLETSWNNQYNSQTNLCFCLLNSTRRYDAQAPTVMVRWLPWSPCQRLSTTSLLNTVVYFVCLLDFHPTKTELTHVYFSSLLLLLRYSVASLATYSYAYFFNGGSFAVFISNREKK